MITPGRKYQQSLVHGIHCIVQHHGAQFFGQWCTARLTGEGYRPTLRPECLRQSVDVRGFACAINAFETDKESTHCHMPLLFTLLSTLVFIDGPIVLFQAGAELAAAVAAR